MERMTSAEFTYWQEYAAIHPFGPEADLWRSAVIAATVANTAGPKKGGKAWQPKDFTPANPRKKWAPLPDNLPPEVRQKLLEARHG